MLIGFSSTMVAIKMKLAEARTEYDGRQTKKTPEAGNFRSFSTNQLLTYL